MVGIEDTARTLMVGGILLLVLVFFFDAITTQLFNKLENAEAFPFGDATKTFFQLLSFVFAALILLAGFQLTRRGPDQRQLA